MSDHYSRQLKYKVKSCNWLSETLISDDKLDRLSLHTSPAVLNNRSLGTLVGGAE